MQEPRSLRWVTAVLLLVVALAIPAPVGASPTMLGTVRGPRTAKLSLNGGKSWLTLGARSLPVMPGTEIRSLSGTAQLILADGTRITLLPFSSATFRETARGTEMSVSYGRLTFGLAPRPALEVLTPAARLTPIAGQAAEGELFVTGAGLTGVKLRNGTLAVRDLGPAGEVVVASTAPVFVPARPTMSGFYFSSDAPPKPPLDARAVFMPDGRSLGYVRADGALVIAPGYTRDLTRPFSPKLVRVAMNAIPDKERAADATPLFDVNGAYVGYLSGPVFYAQSGGPWPARDAVALTESASVEMLAPATLSAGTVSGTSAVGSVVGVGTLSSTGTVVGETAGQEECLPPLPEATPTQPSSCGS